MSSTPPLSETGFPANLVTVPDCIFRAYDIRGVVDTHLNSHNIRLMGQAIGSEALSRGIDCLLLGRDGRTSSPDLHKSLLSGILASGCDVVDLAIVPTPVVYFTAYNSQWQSGVMLTASHNPSNYNGVKIFFQRNSLSSAEIKSLQTRILQNELTQGSGVVSRLNILDEYRQNICDRMDIQRPLKVVLDCSNAVTSVIAPALFESIGCQVTPLFCSLDGTFPNHPPDPTRPDNLKALRAEVVRQKADLGIAFDGDGDRLGLVTEQGEVIDADRLMVALIRDILPGYSNMSTKPYVVYDVKCSTRVAKAVADCGGIPVMQRSGHSFMKQKMLETNAVLGGEYAAHIFIRDQWFGFDDGMYAAVRVVELLSRRGIKASDLFANQQHWISTPEISIPLDDERKFALMDEIKAIAQFPNGKINLLDGLRAEFSNGWGLVRASNTSPTLLLRFEADTEEALASITNLFRQLLHQADEKLVLPF